MISPSVPGDGVPLNFGKLRNRGRSCIFSWATYTRYVRSKGKVLGEYSGVTGSSREFTFIYAGNQRIAMIDSEGKLHFYLNDHLGSARMVIDTAGTVKDNYDYYAFGEALDQTISTGQSYRYTGKPFDNDHGLNLHYYGARYYDGTTGRFISVDPLAVKYPNVSPYVYALNNPMTIIDPNGMEVVIKGDDSQQAATNLNEATSLDVTIDTATGKLSCSGTAKTDADYKLRAAINSSEITVTLKLTKDGSIIASDGSCREMIAGLYDGSVKDTEGHVTTSQYLNLDMAKTWEALGGGTVGQSVLHELNESLFGGQMFPGQPYSSERATRTHDLATAIDPPQGVVTVNPKGFDSKGRKRVTIKGPNGEKTWRYPPCK